MANPRKFSEKIALQKQKQAEGTAEFEKIMKEVSDATSKQDESHYNQRLMECGISNTTSNTTTPVHRESRGRSVGIGPMRRPSDRRVDRSPYSNVNVAYLSPPSDTCWRRASSDSAIHQSLIQTPEKHHGSHSPISLSPTAQRRCININTNAEHRHFLNKSPHQNSSNVDVRQVSNNEMSRLPGVNAYSPQHENNLSAPIGNNTGSLPDLTSVHFASPLNTPLDKEQEHSSSPYSSSPITASPTTLSPTSMPNRYYSPAHSPSDSNTYSPTHFSSNARQNFLAVPGSYYSNHLINNKNTQFDNQYRTNEIGQTTTHLSFTNLPSLVHIQQRNSNISNNSPLHGSHGNLSSIGIAAGNLTEYRSPQCRPSPGSSPGVIPSIPTNDSNPSAPCSPVPQNCNSNNGQTYDKFQSPNNDGYNLNQSFQNHFEQFSLVDNTTSEYIPNLQSTQSNFTTLQFDDSAFAQLGSVSNSSNQNTQHQQQHQQTHQQQQHQQQHQQQQHQQQHQPQHQQQHQQQQQQQQSHVQNINRDDYNMQNTSNVNKSGTDGTTLCNSRISQNTNLGSPLQQNMMGNVDQQILNQQKSYASPNTPTSIPEIVFSDFSSGNPDFSREIFGSLDLELGPMDVAGLQMLSDPNSTMIADPTIEDSFRRDLN